MRGDSDDHDRTRCRRARCPGRAEGRHGGRHRARGRGACAFVPAEATGLVSKIIELASNPGVNPEMFDRLVAWQEREEERQAEERFNAAMNRAQAEIQPVARNAENKHTNSFYATLEDVDAAIRPIYLRHGFTLSSYGTVEPLTPGQIRVMCEVALGRHKKLYYREAAADTLGPRVRRSKPFCTAADQPKLPEAVCGLRRVQCRLPGL